MESIDQLIKASELARLHSDLAGMRKSGSKKAFMEVGC